MLTARGFRSREVASDAVSFFSRCFVSFILLFRRGIRRHQQCLGSWSLAEINAIKVATRLFKRTTNSPHKRDKRRQTYPSGLHQPRVNLITMSHFYSTRAPASFDDCTDVSPDCPVGATVLGYVPNLGSSIFFAIAFGLCLFGCLGLGIWKRTWTYCAAISVGVLLECLGKESLCPCFPLFPSS